MVALGDIRNVVQKIVQSFRPERVVLFGSFARQTAGHDSDVDLLVWCRMRARLQNVRLKFGKRSILDFLATCW